MRYCYDFRLGGGGLIACTFCFHGLPPSACALRLYCDGEEKEPAEEGWQ